MVTENSVATLSLNRQTQQVIVNDAYERSDIEACGVLLGTMDSQGNWNVSNAIPLPNIYHSPVYFEFAPEDLLEVELTYPDQIIGVYHSHPTGYPQASETDYQNMQRINVEQNIPWVWIIVLGPFLTQTLPDDALQSLPDVLIAYHFYSTPGLQHIPIHLD